ncbi:MAG: acyl-CoA dehydrogenase family protein [Candidatus Obscuribacterales bacterium]|nr:acyl-CoA dehydrogenase family protein [Candidatus Obscuribacterales bacterium]
MNTFLSCEQEVLLENYRAFVKESILSESFQLDEAYKSSDKVKEVIGLLGGKGYLGINISKEYGGQGGSFLDLILFSQALGSAESGLALSLASHYAVCELISRYGSDTQKSRYLPLLARGEVLGAMALSEEHAGSDFKAATSRLVKDGDNVKLAGKKVWVVNGELAQLAVVSARLDNELVLALVDLEPVPSIKVSSNREKLGLRSARTNDLEFVAHQMTSSAILGGQKVCSNGDGDQSIEDKTAEMIGFAADVSKTIIAASAIGLLDAATGLSVDRANSREQFDASIGKLQAIQWKLADLSADSAGARLLVLRAAWSKDHAPEEFARNAAMAKFYASKTARFHSSEAVQICGSMGISAEEPVEKLYRDAKVMEIVEGTSEIQKNIIAQEVGA